MPITGGVARAEAGLEAATSLKVYNVSVTSASTEFSQALSSGTKGFNIAVRDGAARMQLAFNTGETNTLYKKISRSQNFTIEGLDFSGTLYFECSATCVVEIVEWS